MAYPLTLFMPVRQGIVPQVLLKIIYLVHRIKVKPTANTGIIHYSHLVLIPESPDNRRYSSIFKRTKALMLCTTFDGGMIPYFRAFWNHTKIRKTFNQLRFVALDPAPKPMGNPYMDYKNFQVWLARQDVPVGGFYSAYKETLQQIYEVFPDEKFTFLKSDLAKNS